MAAGRLAPALLALVFALQTPTSRAAALPKDVQQQVAQHAKDAKVAARSAEEAALKANQVADHSVYVNRKAQAALKHAKKALEGARESANESLSDEQKKHMERAEEKLRDATQEAQYGRGKDAAVEGKLGELKSKLGEAERSELDELLEELRKLRREVEGTEFEEEVRELEGMVKDLKTGKATDMSLDEIKAELENLREAVRRLEESEASRADEASSTSKQPVEKEEEEGKEEGKEEDKDSEKSGRKEYTVGSTRGAIDIDTEMPYGDLEPFGREDTAQELTEASIHESDQMVDQIERAEVAEEKRAVFRALTRLRGAAIASYDGVARSQTGNIDQYNKVNKWRPAHPLHHLAQEESDVSKWAFPEANL